MQFRNFTVLVFIISATFPVQAKKKAAKKTANQIRTDITYLASDELEGRRTGTEGERKAGDYIETRYKNLNIPAYKGQYRYPFKFVYGKEEAPSTFISVNARQLKCDDDVFALPFSATKHVTGDVLPEVTEQGNIWLVPLFASADQANDPHFDWEKHCYDAAREAAKGGASGVAFYDAYGSKYEPSFNKQCDLEQLEIPVIYIKYKAYDKFVKQSAPSSQKNGIPFDLNIIINKTERTGTNIAAYVDNGAKYTVIIGAHYDHLGYGEDHNSLYANAAKEHLIHHGADDNASGTAALMELAKWVKHSKLHNYNYLFIHFSGEELGLYGSKAFVKDQKVDSAQIAYMMNLDMVGRLNDSTHSLTLGGVGTSPRWADVVAMGNKDFKINIDSAGVGPSDHTSFYNAGIPVLFFFTGTHPDYHKPSDKSDIINYPGEVQVIQYAEDVITKMDNENIKPAYTVTRTTNTGGRSKFKVTLGIMPDYTFQDGGVKVDGVTDNRPAAKAGIKRGDIILQLGDIKIQGMQTYMEALGKLAPGEKTEIRIKRDNDYMTLPVELAK